MLKKKSMKIKCPKFLPKLNFAIGKSSNGHLNAEIEKNHCHTFIIIISFTLYVMVKLY